MSETGGGRKQRANPARLRFRTLGVLLAVLGASSAHAEEAGDGETDRARATGSAGVPSGGSDVAQGPVDEAARSDAANDAVRRTRARGLFERGRVAYEAGRYPEALEAWQGCYALAISALERARVLWNLAQAYRKTGQCVPAREKYEAYLQSAAGDEAEQEAHHWLEQLAAQCPAPKPSVTTASTQASSSSLSSSAAAPERSVPAPAPIAKARGAVSPLLVWSLFGTAAATAIATGASAYAGHLAEGDFRRLARQAQTPPEAALQDNTLGDKIAAAERRGQRYNGMAWWFAGGSVVFSGVATALLVLPWGERPEQARWSLSVEAQAGLVLGCSTAF